MAIKAPFGGIDWEFGINWYTLLYIKQINNKGLLYRTGKYIQCLVITYNGKESEKKYTCNFAIHLKLTQHCKLTIFQ